MKHFVFIFYILFALFIPFFISANEKEESSDLIEIMQMSSSKFYFFKNGQRLYSKSMITYALKDDPLALEEYRKARNARGGMSAMVGLGIGISSFSTFMVMYSLIFLSLYSGSYYSTYYYTDYSYNYRPSIVTNPWLWITVGFGTSFIGSIIMWVVGAKYRRYYKNKEVEAIKGYNKRKNDNLSQNDKKMKIHYAFCPSLSFDKDLNPYAGMLFELKF